MIRPCTTNPLLSRLPIPDCLSMLKRSRHRFDSCRTEYCRPYGRSDCDYHAGDVAIRHRFICARCHVFISISMKDRPINSFSLYISFSRQLDYLIIEKADFNNMLEAGRRAVEGLGANGICDHFRSML